MVQPANSAKTKQNLLEEFSKCYPHSTTYENNLAEITHPIFYPNSIIDHIHNHCMKYAAMKCGIRNLELNINNLNEHLLTNTIPSHIEKKFKNIFNKDSETSLKSELYKIEIKNTIEYKSLKIKDLQTKFNENELELDNMINPTLNMIKKTLNREMKIKFINFSIDSITCSMVLKQTKDAEAKTLKRKKFEESKASMNASVDITNRDIITWQKKIKSLQKDIENLRINKNRDSSSKNGKGKKNGQPLPAVKQKRKGKEIGNMNSKSIKKRNTSKKI